MGLFKRGALSCVHEKPFGQILNFPYNLFSLSIAMQVPCVQTAAGRAGASGTILPHQHRLSAGPDRREAPLSALQAKTLKQHPKIKPAPCKPGRGFFWLFWGKGAAAHHSLPDEWTSLYSIASIRAFRLASMMSADTPTVVQLSCPSVDSIRTRTLEAVRSRLSRTLTL